MSLVKQLRDFFSLKKTPKITGSTPRLFNHPSILNQRCYIDGQLVNADSNKVFPLLSPLTQAPLAFIPSCGIAETTRAIAAAQRSAPAWSNMPVEKRSLLLCHWAYKIQQNQKDLATLLAIQQGKIIQEGQEELAYAYKIISKYSQIEEKTILPRGEEAELFDLMQNCPYVAIPRVAIDFPIARLVKIVSLALFAGKPLVLRVEDNTAYSSLTIASLAQTCAFPAGVINIFTGDAESITPLLKENNGLVDYWGKTQQPVALKSSPCIIFNDADLNLALNETISLAFYNSGQNPLGVSHIIIQESLYESFYQQFIDKIKQLHTGNPLDPTVNQGSLAGYKVLDAVDEQVKKMVSKEGHIAHGGYHNKGLCYEPTVITFLELPSHTMQYETIIGPVVVLATFKEEKELFDLVNSNCLRTAAYIFSENIQKEAYWKEKLAYKTIFINQGRKVMVDNLADFI